MPLKRCGDHRGKLSKGVMSGGHGNLVMGKERATQNRVLGDLPPACGTARSIPADHAPAPPRSPEVDGEKDGTAEDDATGHRRPGGTDGDPGRRTPVPNHGGPSRP